jgi:hypothetical protein
MSSARGSRGNLSHVVSAAQNFVCNLCIRRNVPDYNLFAFDNHDPTNSSCVVGSTRAAPTQRFDLQGIYAI